MTVSYSDDYCGSTQNQKYDEVSNPKHYTNHSIECIDLMEELFGVDEVKSFCKLNAFKYLFRSSSKHETPEKDIAKASWYLQKYQDLGSKLVEDSEGEDTEKENIEFMKRYIKFLDDTTEFIKGDRH